MISVNFHKLRVVGVIDGGVTINNDGFINSVQVIVNDETYDLLTGVNRYSEVYPILKADADFEEFEEWLDSWCNENPGSHWLSYRQTNEQLAESFEQINMLCLYQTFLWEGAYYGIISSIAGGILGYICTVYINAAMTETLQFEYCGGN